MQTFLPYPNFEQTAQCLDYRRLGKQRVEAMQILNELSRKDSTGNNGWARHPAVLMWRGYENCLAQYQNVMIAEWVRRGYNNTMCLLPVSQPVAIPPWMTLEAFHASHRAALLAKEPTHYGGFGWQERPVIDYWWPTKNGF